MNLSEFRNKTVLITGHTGFKGSWLTCWLLKLGAKVIGISDCIPTSPSLFESLKLETKIDHILGDIRDDNLITNIILRHKPDFVFHLAAQAIVSKSYIESLETISINVMGTASVLEAIKNIEHECSIVIITSDKCYENVEWEWGYKETDNLGGKDIYSGSKGAAEIIFHAYFNSFLRNKENIAIATGRAGNVIGGGDWAQDRIVVDCFESWESGVPVQIRSPQATRPWQHVLEPLSGYLNLAMTLRSKSSVNGESFNFGPQADRTKTVVELMTDLYQYWYKEIDGGPFIIAENKPFHEASLLKLNCDKALYHLNWKASLSYDQCVQFVGEWYADYFRGGDMYEATMTQIAGYEAEKISVELDRIRVKT